MSSEDRDSTSVVQPDETEPRSSRSSGKGGSKRARRKRRPLWQETILLVGVAMVLAIVIKALFVQAFYIPSESMQPGLEKNDRILVEKPSYWFGGSPQRGDVVVFEDPGGWLPPTDQTTGNPVQQVLTKVGLYPSGGHLVKRVIGVAGDTITCCDTQGRISVNGHPLDEQSYARLGDGQCYGPMVGDCQWSAGPVPPGHVFVMGDNRSNSRDSTAHMCLQTETDCSKDPYVDVDDVVGRVFVLLWPGDRFTFLHRPATFADVPNPA